MEFRFDRKEPGVWISAGTHVALLALALFSVDAGTDHGSIPRHSATIAVAVVFAVSIGIRL